MLLGSVLALTALAILALTGCGGLGPSTIVKDRFNYVGALSESWKRQMLLNLVKVRYGEAPVFMDVGSVIGAYSWEGDIRGIGEYALPGTYISGDRIARVEATGTYTDRPTITYQPLSGDKFARSVVAPIPMAGILSLIESGYPADIVLRAGVNTINGLRNHYGGPGNPRTGDPKFRELLDAIREAQAAGVLGFRMDASKSNKTVVMFTQLPTLGANVRLRRVFKLLRLKLGKREYRMASAAIPDREIDIAILTRSIMQVMTEFASYIDVPVSDVAEGRIYNPERAPEQDEMFPPFVNVRESVSYPADAFVAIQYRDRWFWIDDRDYRSKLLLTFLMLMFSLTENSSSQPAPVVTIPAR